MKLGKTTSGDVVRCDLDKLIGHRLLIQAASGGGKSWLLRLLCEQVASNIQTIVIDPEGEFASLREKLDLVLVGPGGEVPADPKNAKALARRLLENNSSRFKAATFGRARISLMIERVRGTAPGWHTGRAPPALGTLWVRRRRCPARRCPIPAENREDSRALFVGFGQLLRECVRQLAPRKASADHHHTAREHPHLHL